jgi:hypothetical protein
LKTTSGSEASSVSCRFFHRQKLLTGVKLFYMNAEAWVTLVVGLGTLLVGTASVVAIIKGPLYALQTQRKLDEEREIRTRKLYVFRTLMSFRATRLSPHFVQALNLIDLEFTTPAETPVRNAWKELQDHYSDWGRKTQEERRRDGNFNVEKADDLLAELLVRMGAALGYTFDKVHIKKGAYYPEGLGDAELEQQAVRKGVLNLLAGTATLPVAVFEQKFKALRKDEAQSGDAGPASTGR